MEEGEASLLIGRSSHVGHDRVERSVQRGFRYCFRSRGGLTDRKSKGLEGFDFIPIVARLVVHPQKSGDLVEASKVHRCCFYFLLGRLCSDRFGLTRGSLNERFGGDGCTAG